MIIKSHAKINLFLKILGKNDQNYHTLESLICFLDIYDIIKIKKSDTLSLSITGEYANFLENDNTENIILKTIKYLAKEFNFVPNLAINLKKNIPIGAGIGGGSANSAAIILAINKIFNLKLSESQLIEIGLKMGCDVPICLNNHMALVQGIGEKLTSIEVKTKPFYCLIANPNKHLSTKEVFESLTISNKNNSQKIPKNSNIIDFIKDRNNDLEAAAIKIMPQISLILDQIKQQKNCLLSRMSGSGATCFGLFDNDLDLKNAYNNLKKEFPQFYVKESRLIYEKI